MYNKMIVAGVEFNENIKRLLGVLNEIIKKFNRIKDLVAFKISVNFLLIQILEEKEIGNYLNYIDKAKKEINFGNIINLISIFTLIYSNKKKISSQVIKSFGKAIHDILINEKKLKLKNDDIHFLIQKIEEILSPNNNSIFINNINYINNSRENNNEDLFDNHFSEKETNFQKNEEELENFKEELEKKSVKSLNSFSSYSENSQHQIMKMKKEIQELQSKMPKKNLMEFIFYDDDNEYNVNVRLGENDKFSAVVDKLFEDCPALEDKEIKGFIYKGEKMKRNRLIKDIDIDLDETPIININI